MTENKPVGKEYGVFSVYYLLSRKYLECEQSHEPEIRWHGNIIISLLLKSEDKPICLIIHQVHN